MKKWQPRFLDHKLKAKEIKRYYDKEVTEKGRPAKEVVVELSEKHGLAKQSIYRYLSFTEVKYPPKKRDKTGRFIPS